MPRRRWRDGGAALALLVLTAAGPTPGGPTPQRQAELRHLLLHDCGSCHGMTLAGGLGPPLTPSALEGKPLEYIEAMILRGRPGSAMPAWDAMLSEDDARWIARYLKAGTRK